MTRKDLDFIGSMNMCDEISNDAYKKIVCHCEEREPCEDCIDRQRAIRRVKEMCNPYGKPTIDFESGKKIIKILEQMSPAKHETKSDVLDKIKSEIEELDEYFDNDYFSGNKDAMYKCNEVLQIIDKYKAESEV